MDILHTTAESIRAALGVTVREISDQQLTDLNLEIQLEVDLDEIYPTHEADYIAGGLGGASDAEIRLKNIIILYCQYQGAAFVLPGIQNFAYQKISDGGTEMQRFSKDNIDKTKEEILGLRDKYRAVLLESAVSEPLSVLALITPSFDPVTNEGA